MKLARMVMFCGAVAVLVWMYRAAPGALTTASTAVNVFDFALGIFVSWCALGMFLCCVVLPMAGKHRRVTVPPRATGPAATSALCNDCGHRMSVHYCMTHARFLCDNCAGIEHEECRFTTYAHGAALRRAKVTADDYKASIQAGRQKASGN